MEGETLDLMPDGEGKFPIGGTLSDLHIQQFGAVNEFHAPGFTLDLCTGKVTPAKGWTEEEAAKSFWGYLQSFAKSCKCITLDHNEAVVLKRVLDGLAMVLREESSSDAEIIESVLKRM